MADESEKDAMHADRASKGGEARMKKLSKAQRTSLARDAAKARWNVVKAPGGNASEYPAMVLEGSDNKTLTTAQWPGVLTVGDIEIPVYVLDDRRRVVSRTGATTLLTGGKGGGNLESYVQVGVLEKYMPTSLNDRMIDFSLPEVVNKSVKGMEADVFIEICTGYVRAWQENALTSDVQIAIAMRAAMFLAACSKVGLIALIDEATGYQHRRAEEELQLKLRMFLLEEMRKW